MSQRLTRKEIKHDIREDEVRGHLVRAFEFLQERPQVVVGAAGSIIAFALVVIGVLAFLDGRRERANEDLAAAIEIVGRPIVSEGATATPDEPSFPTEEERTAAAKEAFEKIQGALGGDAAGDVANLYLADIAANEGDTETARTIWNAFLSQRSDHVLAVSVKINLIHLDRQNGRAQEVVDDLQQALEEPRKILPEDVILFELAQTLEVLDQKEAALDAYQRIIDEHPRSPYTAKAREITTSTS